MNINRGNQYGINGAVKNLIKDTIMNPQDTLTKSKVEMLIQNNQVLVFDYTKEDLEVSRNRIVLPMQVITGPDSTNDRFLGYDFSKNGMRQFLFKGMDDVKVKPLSEGLLLI